MLIDLKTSGTMNRRNFFGIIGRLAIKSTGIYTAAKFLSGCASFDTFNSGMMNKIGPQEYQFSVTSSKDGGCIIYPEELKLSSLDMNGKNLVFEIKGYFIKESIYEARLIVQVYDVSDPYDRPSIRQKVTEFQTDLSQPNKFIVKDYMTARIPLGDRIKKLGKIQFMLLADPGTASGEFFIKNIRFEDKALVD